VTFVIFDVLRIDGTDVMERPYSERRSLLEGLDLNGPGWATSETAVGDVVVFLWF
jgi:bifunctional non-homologous end joining protein LigD